MSPGRVSQRIVADRISWVQTMLADMLYTLCANNLEDIRAVIQEITDWLNSHPQIMDSEL